MKWLLPLVLITPALAQLDTPQSPRPDAFSKAPIVIPMWKEIEATGDKAFGAYQRGFYLTSFKEAVIEIEKTKSPTAMVLLAELYSGGLGVAKDDAKALQWYRAAADKGDRNAIYSLGLMALQGRSMEKDKQEAFKQFEKAGNLGHLAAIYNLGLIYMEREEDVKAANMFEKAAIAGLADAQYALAQFIENGRGRPKDLKIATNWLAKAAAQNLTEAEIDYALALVNGKGINKNEVEGVAYLKRAALKGNAIAQNRYARALFVGKGVKADPLDAARWHALATFQGISDLWMDGETAKLPERDRRGATSTAMRWYNFTNQ